MQKFRVEFHVHTVLSPCAEIEMIPPLIVSTAIDLGIDVIAITDHNSISNVEAVQKAAKNTNLSILPGMELQTREEVHLLCIFERLDQLANWNSIIEQRYPNIKNKPEYFGEQFIVDESGDFLRREEKLLITSVDISFDEAVNGVKNNGGLAIPAHINRQAYGLLANLGFIPQNTPVDALELSRQISIQDAKVKFPQISSYPLLRGGDVHRLEEFLGANEFIIESPTINEFINALNHLDGRSYKVIDDNLTII